VKKHVGFVSAAQREKGKAAKFRLRPPMEGLGAHKLCKEGVGRSESQKVIMDGGGYLCELGGEKTSQTNPGSSFRLWTSAG